MSRNQVSFPTNEVLAPLARRFGLQFIVVFGSAARGKMHEESDIDVGVLADRPLNSSNTMKLWYQFASLFRADIDFTVLNHASPLLGFEVARDGRLLYERKRYAWETWRSYKIRQYWDTTKFRDDLRRHLARRITVHLPGLANWR